MITIEWRGSCDFGEVFFQQGFKQRIYIDSVIANPDYDLREEGGEDGQKQFHQTFALFKKIYKFEFIAPEYICDAMTLIPLHDDITIYDGFVSAKVDDIEVDVDWQDWYFAKVTVSFTIDRLMKAFNDSNLTLSAGVPAPPVP